MNFAVRSELWKSQDFAGKSATARLVEQFDWGSTRLGPISSWPESLKTVARLMLLSPVPMIVLWGDAGVMIYNDSYAEFAGGRHPDLLGREVREGWPEVADFNDNVMKVGLAGGTLAYRDQELTLYRNGRPEQVWLNLDYSPVLDESGRPAGVIAVVVETTDRVRAERTIVAERERLTRMFEQAPGLMALLSGPDHRFELVNPAYKRMIGQRDVVGRAIREALPEVARQGFIEVLDEVYSSGRAFVGSGVRVALQNTSGREQEFVLDFVYQPVVDDVGAITGIFVEGYDVTDRFRAEEQVRRSEERFRALLNATSDIVYRASPDWQTIRRLDNRGAVSDARENREWWRGYVAEPDVPKVQAAIDRAIATRGVYQCEHRAPAEGGGVGWVFSRAVPILDEAGDVIEWFGAATDITARKAAEDHERRFREALEEEVLERTAALRRSESNIRTIFATSHLFQGLMSVEGLLLYANDTSLASIEASLDDVVGRHFWDTPWFTGTPGMPEIVEQAVARVAEGATEHIDMTLNLPTGVRSFDFSMRPVRDDAGRIVAMVPEAVDKTARVKAEQTIAQMQKMEAIGALSGGLAHDFNNLLMVVLSSLEMMRRRVPPDPALLRLLDNAEQAVRRGSSLTSRMLTFARRQDLRSELIDVNDLVQDMIELLRRSLGPTIDLVTALPKGLPAIEADANQLEAALLNLAVNARDATRGEGRIEVVAREAHVRSEGLVKPGPYVVLGVVDNGEGMDVATLERATEPFFTTKGIGKGTGLGLSMVHGFAQQSGGALILRSSPGAGTTAEIWLPAVSAAPERQPEQPGEPAPAAAEARLAILVVDDDPLVLMNTVDMLEDLGHRVRSAASGEEALKLLEQQPPDLLITDHAMPRMTGAQLVETVRRMGLTIPVLLATGYAELPSAGSDLHRLAKPFSQKQLEQAIRSVARAGAA